MLEKIRIAMMVRNANRRVACEKWNDVVDPRIKKKLDKIGRTCTDYKVHRAGQFAFQVVWFNDGGSQYAVDLGLHTCTCRRWQISGIPCVHALCCIRFQKQEATLYCDDYYFSSTYMKTYDPVLYPIAGEKDWEPVDFPIAPPKFNKLPGRPKKKRIPSQGETNPEPLARNDDKMPRTGLRMTCNLCGKQGHNKRGCPITKANKADAPGEGSSGAGVAIQKRVRKKVIRQSCPPMESRPLNEQIIKSKRGWKRQKLAMDDTQAQKQNEGSCSHVHTESSQNVAAEAAN